MIIVNIPLIILFTRFFIVLYLEVRRKNFGDFVKWGEGYIVMVCWGRETEKKYPWSWMRAWQVAFFAKWGWGCLSIRIARQAKKKVELIAKKRLQEWGECPSFIRMKVNLTPSQAVDKAFVLFHALIKSEMERGITKESAHSYAEGVMLGIVSIAMLESNSIQSIVETRIQDLEMDAVE